MIKRAIIFHIRYISRLIIRSYGTMFLIPLSWNLSLKRFRTSFVNFSHFTVYPLTRLFTSPLFTRLHSRFICTLVYLSHQATRTRALSLSNLSPRDGIEVHLSLSLSFVSTVRNDSFLDPFSGVRDVREKRKQMRARKKRRKIRKYNAQV